MNNRIITKTKLILTNFSFFLVINRIGLIFGLKYYLLTLYLRFYCICSRRAHARGARGVPLTLE